MLFLELGQHPKTESALNTHFLSQRHNRTERDSMITFSAFNEDAAHHFVRLIYAIDQTMRNFQIPRLSTDC